MSIGLRSLDHFVITVGDVDTAGSHYEALGFQVLPRMRHLAVGSENRVVQLGRTYIELVGNLNGLAEPYGSHYRNRLLLGDGIANICFTSSDLEADRTAIQAAKLDPMPITSARRPVIMPDGTVEETDSNFFYAWRPGRPYMSPFLAEHRKRHVIFVSQYQVHPNTALDVVGVTCVSDNPFGDATHFALLAGADKPQNSDCGLTLALAEGDFVEFLTQEECDRKYDGAITKLPTGACGLAVGMTISVASLQACREALRVPYKDRGSDLMVVASAAGGVFLRFLEAPRPQARNSVEQRRDMEGT